MSFIHSDILDNAQFEKMEQHFQKRTQKHIQLVQQYCNEALQLFPEYQDKILSLMNKHDGSKFQAPEYEPYVWLTWKYKCKGEGNEFSLSNEIEHKIHDMTFHHVRNNPHHPEFWDKHLKTNPISFEDRDKPSGIIVNATKMEIPYLIEMCCDWCAVSAERNPANKYGPVEWADKNIDKRWKFDKTQKELIYGLLNKLCV